MTLEELAKKKIGILGLGANHMELTALLLRHDADVTVRDRNQEKRAEFATRYPKLAPQLKWQTTDRILDKLNEYEVVFRSPSIPYLSKELQQAIKKGVEVYSQTRLFFDLCPAPIIGVTGTKGKGTTSSLIYRILEAGYTRGKVYLAGNIGLDPFEFYEKLTADDIVVLELSSFQTQDLHKSPHIAVILPVGVDHLNHHKDIAEYRAAKANLLAHQELNDIAIINAGDPAMQEFVRQSRGKVYRYARYAPRRESAWAHKEKNKETIFIQIGNKVDSFDSTDRALKGEHNLDNILPAVLVASSCGIDTAVIARTVRSFEGLPHRLSLVGTYTGVDFYDDSYATIPEPTIAAINAFPGRHIHLIAGGNDKGADYLELARLILAKCATVSLLPGTATKKLQVALKRARKERASNCQVLDQAKDPLLPTILSGIQPHLQSGDLVLLSPAATSFASFKNVTDRGESFVAAVRGRYDKKDA